MLALNYKIDTFYLPLDAYYSGNNKDKELTHVVEGVTKMVHQFIDSPVDVKTFADFNLDALFSFRMSALKWLIDNNIQLDNLDFMVENKLEPLKNDPIFSVLYQNVLFAIRVNMRVMKALINPQKLEVAPLDISEFSSITHFSFTGFLNMISLTAPDAILTTYVDWLTASLYIEFGIISTFIIYKENLSISTQKVNELAAFTANSAHDFGAIAKEIKPSPTKRKQAYPLTMPNDFLTEQLFLAEQDIQLFQNN